MMDGLINAIRQSLTRVSDTDEFKDFAQKARLKDGDWVLLNNSFLLRNDLNLGIRKNDLYLAFEVRFNGERHDVTEVVITCPETSLNNPFRKLGPDELGSRSNLAESVTAQVQTLGSIVTCLIGQIYEEPTRVPVPHPRFSALILDPESDDELLVVEPEIRIRKLRSVAFHWSMLEKKLVEVGVDALDIASFANPFDVAYKNLREQHHEKIRLPRTANDLQAHDTILSRIVSSIEQEIRTYDRQLNEFLDSGSETAYHEVLRISYNFAEALFAVLGLVVGICDLKPILSWLTCGEQLKLYEVFLRELPQHQSGKKPSLKDYRDAIGGARNHRFHKLLSFSADVIANLEGLSIPARSLRLFTEYKRNTSKRTAVFDFDDREIVELLAALTRTSEQEVPREWWQANLRLMVATLQLVRAFQQALIDTTRVALNERRQAA